MCTDSSGEIMKLTVSQIRTLRLFSRSATAQRQRWRNEERRDMKKEQIPRAAKAILKNAYVDDICDSVNNVPEGKALMSDIDEVLYVSGFNVKQGISSEQSDVKENRSEVTIGGESQVEKVLGTVWLPREDMFTFKIKLELAKENLPLGDPGTFIPLKLTKRLIRSKLPGVFSSYINLPSDPPQPYYFLIIPVLSPVIRD